MSGRSAGGCGERASTAARGARRIRPKGRHIRWKVGVFAAAAAATRTDGESRWWQQALRIHSEIAYDGQSAQVVVVEDLNRLNRVRGSQASTHGTHHEAVKNKKYV